MKGVNESSSFSHILLEELILFLGHHQCQCVPRVNSILESGCEECMTLMLNHMIPVN